MFPMIQQNCIYRVLIGLNSGFESKRPQTRGSATHLTTSHSQTAKARNPMRLNFWHFPLFASASIARGDPTLAIARGAAERSSLGTSCNGAVTKFLCGLFERLMPIIGSRQDG